MNANNGKKKLFFNFIDVLLIVAILAATVTVVFFLRERRILTPGSNETVEVIYQIEVSPLREDFRNLVSIGDRMTDSVKLSDLGEITDVSYAECRYTGVNKTTGAIVTSTFPGHVTMILTIRADALLTEAGYEIDGRLLLLGQPLSFRTPDFTGTGTCLSLEPLPDTAAPD
ncbi:MAG: DUF4330 domain-containing protein [Ruminococcaceae bacterium]|nr:DUF4330 domain-containing protein [Oscillospiraceae bacterium]